MTAHDVIEWATHVGVELAVHGGKLAARTRDGGPVPRDVLAQLRTHRDELAALLTARDGATEGPWADAGDAVAAVRRSLPGARIVAVLTARARLARALRHLRQTGRRDDARDARAAWRERAAIIEYAGNEPRPRAEGHAVADVLADPDLAGVDAMTGPGTSWNVLAPQIAAVKAWNEHPRLRFTSGGVR